MKQEGATKNVYAHDASTGGTLAHEGQADPRLDPSVETVPAQSTAYRCSTSILLLVCSGRITEIHIIS